MRLAVIKRKNMAGKPCIAPFINGSNVWDIPEAEWTPAVQEAVIHAFKLGLGQAELAARRAVSSSVEGLLLGPDRWPTP